MIVRQARLSDAGAACDVLRRSIIELCGSDHGNLRTKLDAWLANKTPENMASWIVGSQIVVAEEEGRLIGVGGMTNTGYITLNYVAPDVRFRGVSKALLSALEIKAAEIGCTSCTLESTKTAEQFYRSRGYRSENGAERRMTKLLGSRSSGGNG